MAHFKRSEMPKFWPLGRKKIRFAPVPVPGAHPKRESMPLNVVVRNVLKMCEKNIEAKRIIKNKEILVNSKEVTEERLPIGLMDIITVKKDKKNYLVVPSRKGFELKKISDKDAEEKYCRIIGKRLLKKGLQLNFHDGRNVILKKEDSKKYNLGDTVIYSLKANKITHTLPYKVGEEVVIVRGRNRGVKGKLKEILIRKDLYGQRAKVEINKQGKLFKKEFIFVVPKEF